MEYKSARTWAIFFLKFILSDDHSRMILDKEEGDPDSDYINANYIDVSLSLKTRLPNLVVQSYQRGIPCNCNHYKYFFIHV